MLEKLSWTGSLIKNIRGFHTYECLEVISNGGLLLGSHLAQLAHRRHPIQPLTLQSALYIYISTISVRTLWRFWVKSQDIFPAGHPRRWHHRQELQGGEPDHVPLRPHHRQELGGQLGLQSPEHRLQRPDPQTSLHHKLHHVSPVWRSPASYVDLLEVWFYISLQECERHHIYGLSEGEDSGQEPVRPGQSQRQGSWHRQVPDRPVGVIILCRAQQTHTFLFTGRTPRTWRPLRQKSTSLPAATSSLSSTTRRWCTGSWVSTSTRCTCSRGGWCRSSRWTCTSTSPKESPQSKQQTPWERSWHSWSKWHRPKTRWDRETARAPGILPEAEQSSHFIQEHFGNLNWGTCICLNLAVIMLLISELWQFCSSVMEESMKNHDKILL